MARSFRNPREILRGWTAKRPSTSPTLGRSHARRFETLEPRMMLAGDIPGLQTPIPAGQLTGKIVYTSGGHGWQYGTSSWTTDRGENNEIVEDFGNQDQMSFFADILLRAGATVVPMRPVGHQLNEVVLDNDSAGVTYSGAWSNSSATVFYDEDYGAVADAVPYRFASIAGTETATAVYRPTIPEEGFYPVYTWVRDGTDRTNQLYRIQDSGGGVTEIRVDHRLVGKGWVYLGTYHFDAGTTGSVTISNQSTAGGSVIIADAIRFGNGMGDMRDGAGGLNTGSISGYPREDEDSLMWTWRALGQGSSGTSIIGTSNVSAPTNMARYMNAAPFGQSVYIGFHSNAGGGRGALGLIDGTAPSPNQASLALYTGRQINQDMQALNGQFEYNWSTRTTHSLSGAFGEINEGASAEFDATIIEVAFHDDVQDAALMRDPRVREQLARSTYEATLEYFDNFGGLATPVSQPAAPTAARAVGTPSGDIQVSWTAGPVGVKGGTATDYRVYVSRDGYGWQGYVQVPAATTSYTFAGANLDDAPYFFKVVAVNSGGESARSSVTSAQVGAASRRVLVVDGYDRYDRTNDERYPYAPGTDGLVDRVRVRYQNTFDYVAPTVAAIASTGALTRVDSVPNEAVTGGVVNLADYDAVVWILGTESTTDDTFNAAEQTAVGNYLSGGGKLFVTGAEVAWDLDQQNNGRTFYNNTFHADYVADDANSYSTTGVVGSIFAGLAAQFDNGSRGYDVRFPDVIAPLGGATAALAYSTGGTAAIQYAGALGQKLVHVGFPFETITSASQRTAIMGAVLNYFGITPFEQADFNADGSVDGGDFLAWQRGFGLAAGAAATDGDANADGSVAADDLAIWQTQFGVAPAIAAAATPLIAAAAPVSAADEADAGPVASAAALLPANRFAAPSAGDHPTDSLGADSASCVGPLGSAGRFNATGDGATPPESGGSHPPGQRRPQPLSARSGGLAELDQAFAGLDHSFAGQGLRIRGGRRS